MYFMVRLNSLSRYMLSRAFHICTRKIRGKKWAKYFNSFLHPVCLSVCVCVCVCVCTREGGRGGGANDLFHYRQKRKC